VGVLIVLTKNVEQQIQKSEVIVESSYYYYLNEVLESSSFGSPEIESVSLNKQEQLKQIRDALMKGYVEMSHINLTICKECQYVEYEAHHTTERLVSGG
jgi:CopG family transcriptional regulator / antitoxin EndoAI